MGQVTQIEHAARMRRHRTAMKVVKRVNDEAARWSLLEFVLDGNPTLEAALAAPPRPDHRRVDLDERQRAVVRMRNEDRSFREIGERVGMTARGAQYAYESAVKKLTG